MSPLVPVSVMVFAYGSFFELDRSRRHSLLRPLRLKRDLRIHKRLWFCESIRKLLDLFLVAFLAALSKKQLLLELLHLYGLAVVSFIVPVV